jgi:hypothetical protein
VPRRLCETPHPTAFFRNVIGWIFNIAEASSTPRMSSSACRRAIFTSSEIKSVCTRCSMTEAKSGGWAFARCKTFLSLFPRFELMFKEIPLSQQKSITRPENLMQFGKLCTLRAQFDSGFLLRTVSVAATLVLRGAECATARPHRTKTLQSEMLRSATKCACR